MKQMLMTIGLIFTGTVGLAIASLIYVSLMVVHSSDTNKAHAIELVKQISHTWSLAANQDTFTPTALAHASTQQGRRSLAIMSRLGRLTKAGAMRQTGYSIDFDTATSVTLNFSGRFENGTSDVTVVLLLVDGLAKIHDLNLKNIRLWPRHQRSAAV